MSLLTVVLICLASCAKTAREPTSDEWKNAMEVLGEWVGNGVFYYFTEDSADYQLDFFTSRREFFAAIISARNDTFGVVVPYVGNLQYSYDYLVFTKIDTVKFLTGDFERLYDSLISIDSCWLIVDSLPFWNNEGLQKLWSVKKVRVGHGGIKWDSFTGMSIEKKKNRKKRGKKL